MLYTVRINKITIAPTISVHALFIFEMLTAKHVYMRTIKREVNGKMESALERDRHTVMN